MENKSKRREMVRVNTRVSVTSNDWMNDYSIRTGLPKSTIIMMAIENFIKEKEVMSGMADMGQVLSKLEELENKIKENE